MRERNRNMAQDRFSLAWDRPFLPGAATHVSLFEGGKDPLNIIASGHGPGEAEALSDLLSALRERRESPDAIAYVSEEYRALMGEHAERRQS
jgi:hypothetical protein